MATPAKAAANRAYYARAGVPRMRRLWTPAEDQFLLTSTLPDVQIALALRRSVHAVDQRRHNMKRKERHGT